jgi:hypothetical protein
MEQGAGSTLARNQELDAESAKRFSDDIML